MRPVSNSRILRNDLYNAIPYEDVISRQRFIVFRIFSFAGMLVCVGAASKMYFTIPDSGFIPKCIVMLALVIGINFYTVKSSSMLHRAYWIMLLACFILLHIVSYSCGGVRTGGILYYGTVIVYAFMLLGRKGGLIFTALFALHVIYLFYISGFTTWTSFDMFKNDVGLINQDFLVNALFSFYLIALQSNYLQSGRNVVTQQLEISKQELENKNQLLEEKNRLLNQYAEGLEKSNSELKKFASVASHDLKAPLRAIGTLSDLIQLDPADPNTADNQQNIAVIKSRVQRMDLLLDALMTYSKADSKTPVYEKINTEVLVSLLMESKFKTGQHKIIFKNMLPEIISDAGEFSKVIEILLDNAIRFNDKHCAEITISSAGNDDEWVFSIKDNGPGIDPKFHEKIFIIFQTIHPRDHFESTGAGLAIAKKIAENLGGKISVQSLPGEGAEFSFTIPRKMAAYSINLPAMRAVQP